MDLFTSIGPLWRFGEAERRRCRSHPPPASASPPLSAPSLFANAVTSREDQSSVWTNHRAGRHQRLHEYIRHLSPYFFFFFLNNELNDLFHLIIISKSIGLFSSEWCPYCTVVTQKFPIQAIFETMA